LKKGAHPIWTEFETPLLWRSIKLLPKSVKCGIRNKLRGRTPILNLSKEMDKMGQKCPEAWKMGVN